MGYRLARGECVSEFRETWKKGAPVTKKLGLSNVTSADQNPYNESVTVVDYSTAL